MIGRVLVLAGVLITIAGVIFSLQGFGVLGGSVMSGSSLWAGLGPLIAIAGLLTASTGRYRLKNPASRPLPGRPESPAWSAPRRPGSCRPGAAASCAVATASPA